MRLPAVVQQVGEMAQALKRFVMGADGAEHANTFEADVLPAERAQIVASRAHRYDADAGDVETDPHDTYVGLALSGGGIRSATFSLGLLQGLRALGVLRAVDYLSTVSGGGYAGAWYSAWLSRSAPPHAIPGAPAPLFPDLESLELARKNGDELDPIHHVRLFANYLTPRKGLLSFDTWRAAAVVSRNLILTWLVLLPLLGAAILTAQLYFIAQPFDDCVSAEFLYNVLDRPDCPKLLDDRSNVSEWGDAVDRAQALVALRPLAALLFLLAWVTVLWIHYNNAGTRFTRHTNLAVVGVMLVAALLTWRPELLESFGGASGPPAFGWLASLCGDGGGAVASSCGFVARHGWDVLLALSTIGAGFAIQLRVLNGGGYGDPVTSQARATRATAWHARLLIATVVTGITLFIAGYAHDWLATAVENVRQLKHAGIQEVIATLGAVLGVAATIFTAIKGAPTAGRDEREVARPSTVSRLVFAAAPVLAILVVASGMALVTHHALVHIADPAPRIPIQAAAFAALALAVVLAWWENKEIRARVERLPATYVAAVAAVLLGTVALTWGPALFDEARHAQLSALTIFLATMVGGYALWRSNASAQVRALLGGTTLAAIAWLVVRFHGFDPVRAESLQAGVALLVALAGWVVALGWMADPNALSLHTFYRTRLIRAYLGASNARRMTRGHDISEPDRADDLRLAEVTSAHVGGPYHLVNTTLNLVGGRDLITAQRSAASFVLAPGYCGSHVTGYRPTARYMGGCLTLGAAIATSGAAVSPNMGSATPSAALSLFLAAMNIRLGLWVPTPSHATWMRPQTHVWPYYLLRESLSQTNALGSYCYLTDGGHFDNTGLYALVERGCRYIIVSDNGADPHPCFADIGEAIRRCRIDFRAEIDLDTRAFRPADPKTPRAVHAKAGTIVYDAEHVERLGWGKGLTPAQRTGLIVWIKPTLLPNDVADVRQYGLENAEFPQQSTADQWFDESQFESYRRLGQLSAVAAFGAACETAPLPPALTTDAVERLFASAGRIAPPPPAQATP